LRRDEIEPPALSPQHDSIDVIALVGGRGPRLAPYTTVLPKLPTVQMPVLEILLRRRAAAGFLRVHLALCEFLPDEGQV
jgi:NDP-sugar pyrophosphorylase family protein